MTTALSGLISGKPFSGGGFPYLTRPRRRRPAAHGQSSPEAFQGGTRTTQGAAHRGLRCGGEGFWDASSQFFWEEKSIHDCFQNGWFIMENPIKNG